MSKQHYFLSTTTKKKRRDANMLRVAVWHGKTATIAARTAKAQATRWRSRAVADILRAPETYQYRISDSILSSKESGMASEALVSEPHLVDR